MPKRCIKKLATKTWLEVEKFPVAFFKITSLNKHNQIKVYACVTQFIRIDDIVLHHNEPA